MLTFLGIDKQKDEIEHQLLDDKFKGMIIYGPTGTGKTSLVRHICNNLRFEIIDIDPDEIVDRIISAVGMMQMNPIVFLFDDIIKIDNQLMEKIVDNAAHKIIIIIDDIKKVSFSLKEKCYEVRFYNPTKFRKALLVEHAKSHGMKNFSKGIPPDFRQAEYMARYGSDGYSRTDSFYHEIRKTFSSGRMSSEIELPPRVPEMEPIPLILILENLHHYYGMDRIHILKKILVADYCRRHEPLEKFKPIEIKDIDRYFVDKKREIRKRKNER